MINTKLLNSHVIVLIADNNKENTQREIAKGNYTHILTSLKIVLSKIFKKNILDQYFFNDHLYLLAVDKIHFVEE